MISTRVAIFIFMLAMFSPASANEAAEPSSDQKLTSAAEKNRLPLEFDGKSFSGPAWDRLVSEGADAQFFLVGEEHGIAENPALVAQLFAELTKSGYSKLAIEISPTMAGMLDATLAADGLEGLRTLYSQPGGEPAFFGMAEEAQMLAAVRSAVPGSEPVLWGTDYEVASDRQLIALLKNAAKPAAAEAALEALARASNEGWAEWEKTGSPKFIFSFAGDPALVTAVKDAWPEPDPRSAVILNTLEKTLQINQFWTRGKPWESNAARAALQRQNFLRYWQAEQAQGRAPRLMAKFGASHLVRGLSQTAVFDLGTLLPELAAARGERSFSVAVMPGKDSMIAGLDPSNWTFAPRSADKGYVKDIQPLIDAALPDTFTLIDLRALRPVVGMNRRQLSDEIFRMVHGFDMLLVMSGSTPSAEFEHE